MKKKYIRTKRTRKWKIIEALGLLFPVPIFALLLLANLSAITEDSSIKGGVAVLLIAFLYVAILLSVPLMLIWRAVFRQIKLKVVRRASFESIQDLDYFREKLDGISPVTISMLTDMQIEPEKDVTATLLHYQMNGIISIEGNVAKVLRPDDPSLLPSDKILLQVIESNGGMLSGELAAQLSGWKSTATQEVRSGRYFQNTDPEVLKKKNTSTCCLGCASLAFVPILISVMAALISKNDIIKYVIGEALPEGAGNREFVQLITTDGKFALGVMILLIFAILYVVSLVWPVIVGVRVISGLLGIERLTRTREGEELTEYIYGMKNFLHDFSELSEVNKEQLVLWDDFLIYAVVLEENDQILKEIFQRKSLDIDAIKFMGHN